MATYDTTSTDHTDDRPRRLRLVESTHTPDAHGTALPRPDTGFSAEVSPHLATAFANLVAASKEDAVSDLLDDMDTDQLRSLAVVLATQINAAHASYEDLADLGANGICAIAADAAAQALGTTREAVLSADRHREVSDARAVAMTAARRARLSLPAIANYFKKDHASVIYNTNKVANNPRLDILCTRITDEIERHYTPAAEAEARDGNLDAAGRSTTLQLAAVEHARRGAARRTRDEDNPQVAVAAGVSR